MHVVAHTLLWTLISLAIGGCVVSSSQFIPGPLPGTPPLALAYPQPEKRVLLIYNHGSKAEYRFDKCDPNRRTTPPVVKALSGQMVGVFDIVVYGLCTNVSPNHLGSTVAVDDLKIMKRVRKIEQVVQAFHDAGVPADHIFLVGHSAGGWASLLGFE